MSSAAAFVKDNRQRHLDQLSELLRIPSISTDPDHAGDIGAAAKWVADRLRAAGCTLIGTYGGESFWQILLDLLTLNSGVD